ncbi:glucose 1-dehydrogenase [Mesorhizobium sp. M1A.F.Ca.IN.020.06.1.1]|uniref:SDR family NAD(P)-dependent oxidoreductase n=1 Tax=unclassified Mesorhizobium TaxID=325217 RepID=UPI000FC9C6E7|nr:MULTISPECIES: glucose 1-dehydrogenase [unclassified Mesorhizobium]RUV84695.1 glucose 1-dehydrogenase [Mesorhizobium sp. M1A.F.Ca.IN.020.32.1.1]RUW04171.1 glucose 1-dehydrogenase [Mesorhizobium sp. M1A.F.Ca.IN.022.05.2.1]RUW31340.1 glucose 1-dehydrogenase [Mesorhizobium sp. M1A.F.Ca.IN.020.06.1.1]RWF81223.1 MAG: glucose 1-dehydrogenase [Mesorhizobium sp.]RWF93486.1 MAG: glucose 1-dehydrogenase [Mesorhizobium sp.]
MRRLEGKVALVMGAGSSGPGWGNGKATAMTYARNGARVVAVDLHRESVDETVALIREEGFEADALCGDATREDDVKSIVSEVMRRHGRIDVLQNNVGITVMGSIEETTVEAWDHVFNLNVKTVFLACKHVLPLMVAQKAGTIVNISSLASLQVNKYPYFSYYGSKSAVNHLTKALAVHYAPHGIRVNAVLPGVMHTPLIYTQIASEFSSVDEMLKARNAASPMGRMGDAWDIANASLFLASDEANYVTGVILPVDGGKSCWGR